MKLSIIIPVYNEEKTIKQVLEKINSVKLPCKKEIIIVNDGSSDATASEINKAIKTPRTVTRRGSPRVFTPRGSSEVEESNRRIVKVINHKKNQGKGAAIRSGIKKTTGDYILIQDADLEYDPKDLPSLLSPILYDKYKRSHGYVMKNEIMAVYGSRFINNKAVIPLLYLIGNKFLTDLTNVLFGTKLTDMETGYKLLPASFLKQTKLNSSHFDIEPEITVKLIKKGFKIIEIPISYHGRTHLAGKKLTFRDAFGAIKTLVKLRYKLL